MKAHFKRMRREIAVHQRGWIKAMRFILWGNKTISEMIFIEHVATQAELRELFEPL